MRIAESRLRYLVRQLLLEDDEPGMPITLTLGMLGVSKSGVNRWSSFPDATQIDLGKETGVGPGERRLAAILNGEVQGPSKPYDLVIPDPGKAEEGISGPSEVEGRWEVKAPDSQTQIRPGTEGLKVVRKVARSIMTVAEEMREFIDHITDDDKPASFIDTAGAKKEYSDIKEWLDAVPSKRSTKNNYELLISGEINADTLAQFTKHIENVRKLSEKIQGEILQINVNGTDFEVTPTKMLRISKILGKDDETAKGELGDVADSAVALSILSNPVFDDPKKLMDEWKAIRASDVFGDTEGLILVNSDGFEFIDIATMDDKVTFARVSQGKPKFDTPMKGGGKME